VVEGRKERGLVGWLKTAFGEVLWSAVACKYCTVPVCNLTTTVVWPI